jgi:cytochrome c oxidase cbb3-type subunit 4
MLSGIVTLLLMLLFIAIWAWAWQPRHRARFDAAARLALDDDAHDNTRESRA